jgi:hypothetical protein
MPVIEEQRLVMMLMKLERRSWLCWRGHTRTKRRPQQSRRSGMSYFKGMLKLTSRSSTSWAMLRRRGT